MTAKTQFRPEPAFGTRWPQSPITAKHPFLSMGCVACEAPDSLRSKTQFSPKSRRLAGGLPCLAGHRWIPATDIEPRRATVTFSGIQDNR
jgi:hypothetical protein